MSESQHEFPISTKPSFLKRWLGWRILALTAVVLILLSPLLYRGWRLGQVPPSEEPFLVDEFPKEIPEEENAAPLLVQATERFVKVADSDFKVYFDQSYDGWDPGDATLDHYLELNQAALEIWRTAASRSRYQLDSETLDDEMKENFIFRLRELNRFAISQIEKVTKNDHPREAISWLEAMMRHAHLIRQNSAELNLLVGISFFAIASKATIEWVVHPDLASSDIQQVLDTMIGARGLAPPLAENIKYGYLDNKEYWANGDYGEYLELYRRAGAEPPLGSKWECWLEAEPQFTLHLMPHLAKNHLLFIDRPRRDRPPLIDGDLFEDSSVRPAKRGELAATELWKLLCESRILDAGRHGLLLGVLEGIDRDEARYRCLTVALAAQAYFRDHGEFPADANQLVPEYLKEIPDDLFSPTPVSLIYRRDGEGAVVYSRYTNEIDDGGTEVSYDEKRTGGDVLDFGFRIRNPYHEPLKALKP
jgi:hypothetical protein